MSEANCTKPAGAASSAAPPLPSDFASWTPEAKAKYVEELRQKKNELLRKAGRPEEPAPAPPAKQYPATKYGYAFVGSKHGNTGNDDDMFFEDEDYDDEDEDEYDDEDLEMFERGLESAAASSHTPVSVTSSSAFVEAAMAVDGSGETVKTDPLAKREFLGDFELLRLAKMGDVQCFKDFEVAMQADVKTFVDNRHRNALHYAVDAGCEELVDYLLAKGVPCIADEKGMTPVHVAVLLQRSQQLLTKLGGTSDTFEKLMDRFAPPVPKFVLSKAPPTAKPAARPRMFWSNSPPAAASGILPSLQLEIFEPQKQHPAGCRTQFYNLTNKLIENSIFTWAKAFDSEEAFSPLYHRCLGIGATHPTQVGAPLAVAGSVLALPLNGHVISKAGGTSLARPAQCGQLHVSGWIERQGVAVRLLGSLAAQLKQLQAGCAFFRCRERLPLEPVCLVKWLRRCIDPLAVIGRVDVACEILPDFFDYEEKLRVDAAVKGYLPLVPQDPTKPPAWTIVSADDADTVARLFQFYAKNVGVQAELHWCPDDPQDMALLAQIFSVFVKVSPTTGVVTDFFALRVLNPRDSEVKIQGALIVLSLFTTITGEAKVLEIAKLLRQYNFSVLFATNTCGFTDSDLSKAQFEEIEAYREYLYVAKSEGSSMLAAGVAAPKVFLPIGPL
jgi:hypothetical protein